jgi:hypothetical protein
LGNESQNMSAADVGQVQEITACSSEEATALLNSHGTVDAAVGAFFSGESAAIQQDTATVHSDVNWQSPTPQPTEEAPYAPDDVDGETPQPFDTKSNPMHQTAAAVYEVMTPEERQRWARLQHASKEEKMRAFMEMDEEDRAWVIDDLSIRTI